TCRPRRSRAAGQFEFWPDRPRIERLRSGPGAFSPRANPSNRVTSPRQVRWARNLQCHLASMTARVAAPVVALSVVTEKGARTMAILKNLLGNSARDRELSDEIARPARESRGGCEIFDKLLSGSAEAALTLTNLNEPITRASSEIEIV